MKKEKYNLKAGLSRNQSISLFILLIFFLLSTNPMKAQTWDINGNDINSGEYFGTNNAEDLLFHTSADERMRILSTGEVGINGTPQYLLDVFEGYINIMEGYGYKQDEYTILKRYGTNIFVGNGDHSICDGIQNLLMGYEAGILITTGSRNTFSGYRAGYTENSHSDNAFFGYKAGYNNRADLNTFIGAEAGYTNASGENNAFLGFRTGYTNTADDNTFIGTEAGYTNTSGFSNAFLGYRAGYLNLAGYSNTFNGWNAGYTNSNGCNNVFLGTEAGKNSTVSSNTFIGSYSGFTTSTGDDNVFVGTNSGYYNTTGDENVFIGKGAGYVNTTGYYNTNLGYQAGSAITTGHDNVCIGHNAGPSLATTSNTLYIGNGQGLSNTLIFGDFSTYDVGIGTITPTSKLDIVETGTNSTALEARALNTGGTAGYFDGADYGIIVRAGINLTGTYPYLMTGANVSATNSGASGNNVSTGVNASAGGSAWNYAVHGSVTATGPTTEYAIWGEGGDYAGWFTGNVHTTGVYTPSDLKLKKSISLIEKPLDKIMQLKPSSYYFRTDEFAHMNLNNGKCYGFIAQELETVFPELVKTAVEPPAIDENGIVLKEKVEFKAIDYISLIPFLVSSIQEQQNNIANLEREIEELKSWNNYDNALLNNKSSLNTSKSKLNQNTPNPFNAQTEISYFLDAKVSNASIIIYNMNGVQLKRYDLPSTGNGKITISSGELVPGIYIYTLIADNIVIDTKRMLLTDR